MAIKTESLSYNDEEIEVEVINMPGDGNCLFSSISYCIFGSTRLQSAVREKIVIHIANNWENYRFFTLDRGNNNFESADEYFNYMSKDGVFGTTIEIQAASEVFGCTFVLFVSSTGQVIPIGEIGQEYRLRFSGEMMNGHFDVFNEMYAPQRGRFAVGSSTGAENEKRNNMTDSNAPESEGSAVGLPKKIENKDRNIIDNRAQSSDYHPEDMRRVIIKYQGLYNQEKVIIQRSFSSFGKVSSTVNYMGEVEAVNSKRRYSLRPPRPEGPKRMMSLERDDEDEDGCAEDDNNQEPDSTNNNESPSATDPNIIMPVVPDNDDDNDFAEDSNRQDPDSSFMSVRSIDTEDLEQAVRRIHTYANEE